MEPAAAPFGLLECHPLCQQGAEAYNLHDKISTGKQIKQLLEGGNQLVSGSRL